MRNLRVDRHRFLGRRLDHRRGVYSGLDFGFIAALDAHILGGLPTFEEEAARG